MSLSHVGSPRGAGPSRLATVTARGWSPKEKAEVGWGEVVQSPEMRTRGNHPLDWGEWVSLTQFSLFSSWA